MVTHLAEKENRLEELKELHDEFIDRECPFTPSITNKSRQICSRRKRKPIHERKSKEEIAQNRKTLRKIQEEKEKEYQENEQQQQQKEKKILKDTYRSNIEWLKAKNERVAQQQIIKIEEGLDKDLVFQPKLNVKRAKEFNFEDFENAKKIYCQ